MKKYLGKDKSLINKIGDFKIEFIPREENQELDILSKYTLEASPVKEVNFI